MCLMSVATLLETLGLGMIIPFLSSLVPSEMPTAASGGAIASEIIRWFSRYPPETIVVGLLLVFVIKNVYLGALAHFQSKFIFGLEADLSKGLLERSLEKPYIFFIGNNSAQIIRNIIGEVSHFCHNAVAPTCGLVAEILVAIGIIALLILVNPSGAVMMAAALGVIGSLFHRQVRNRVAHWGEARQHHEGMRLQKLQESFGALREIKIAGLQTQFCAAYAKHTDGSCASGRRQQTIQNLPRLLLEILAVLALVMVVLSSKGPQRVGMIPVLGLYAAAAFRLMPSANRILNSLQAIRFAKPSIDLLMKEFVDANVKKNSIADVEFPFEKNLSLKDVEFRYSEQGSPVFKSVNLEIKKGDVICVMGPSGAGKSTLVDVLCGLLPPSSGNVLVDGQAIEGKEHLWQKHIAYVPQVIFLIDGTIKENIALGVSPAEIDEHRLLTVIKTCGLEELVSSHPDGLNASVGERGAKISGGQRQRIGLAREIYRGRDVLILDEATNALDARTEAEVVASIGQSRNQMTIIWITHGTTPLRYADKVVTVQDGCVSIQTSGKGEPR